MALRASPRRSQVLESLGANIRRWRRLNGMSATDLAERATVTRATLRSIESGTGTARLDSVMTVLIALGLAEAVTDATDPYRSAAGRARIDDLLRQGRDL